MEDNVSLSLVTLGGGSSHRVGHSFGKDMPDERRLEIVAKYQSPVKFKQVVVGRVALEIIDFL